MMRNEALQPVPVQEPVRLTKDEEQYLRSCLNNELWTFELPTVLTSGVVMKLAMNYGYLKQSRGNLLAVIFGTFVLSRGLSYNDCFKRLLQLPGNDLAERINQRKRIVVRAPGEGIPTNVQSPEVETQYQQPNYLDLDSERPDFPGIDSSIPQPNVNDEIPSKPAQSYADLRRQNRESYQQQLRGGRSSVTPEAPSTPPPRQDLPGAPTYEAPSQEQPPTAAQRKTRVNKYGDVWDE